MSLSYQQAEHYLLGTINETISRRLPYRLERMHEFMHALGDPQDTYPTLHIGGTSGKGSTSTMSAAMLQAAGKRVGLHTKPHMRSMRERARVDGVPVSEERFAELLSEMMPAIDRVAAEFGRPTYYETLLALAFLHFARERVDVAVIEVGLGGRLDGTNIITPVAAAITSVGFDHTEVLGDTLEAIAIEKAGIAKPNVPLIVGVTDPGVRAVIAERAAAAGAPVILAADAVQISDLEGSRLGQHFTATTARGRYDVRSRVLGGFQRQNAQTAIALAEALPEALQPSIADVEHAFASLSIAGRMEVFPGHPSVVFDIAHNVEKAAQLAAALRETFGERHFVFVVSVSEGKDAVEIVRALGELGGSFVFTGFQTEGRTAIVPARLARMAEGVGFWGRALIDPVEALSIARRNAGADDVVVVTGSTFIVAELREWWFANVAQRPEANA